MKSVLLTAGLILSAGMVFSSNVFAQANDNPTIPRVAKSINDSGPWAGLFDEFNSVMQDDYLYRRIGAAANVLAFGGPFTVFAPTNGAFQALNQTLACNGLSLADVPEIRRAALFSHATAGRLYAADVVGMAEITMASGVTFSQSGGVITDAAGQQVTILLTDVEASNGVIHVIDKVLLPADLGLKACGE